MNEADHRRDRLARPGVNRRTTTHRSERAAAPRWRKNFYGSGSLWSGRVAAMMFLLLATLAHSKINPRLWLTWYLESCAEADGKAPVDIQPFLPSSLPPERLAASTERTTVITYR